MSVWLTGIAKTRLNVQSLFSIAHGTFFVAATSRYAIVYRFPQQAMPNLHGLVFGIADGKLPAFWIQIVTLALSLCVFAWTAIRGRRIHSASGLILLAITCSVLISHYVLIHDLSILLLPIVALLNSFLLCDARDDRKGHPIGRGAAVCMFVAPGIWAFSTNQFHWVALAIVILWLAIGKGFSAPTTAPDLFRSGTLVSRPPSLGYP